jgi:molybdate transport system substrate-binding protein
MKIHRRLSSLLGLALLFCPAFADPGAADEIRILNANALTVAMKQIAADFTKETRHQVSFVGVSPGLVDQRVKAGEQFDIVITSHASSEAFDKEGKWRPGSRRPFARVGIGFAVRDGVKLDLSTVESTKKALLDAKSITYSDSSTGGLSGINAAKVLANLGLTDAVKAKTQLASGGLEGGQKKIADGEIEIGLFNLSEIPRTKGVVRAGPAPEAVQVYINYDAAVPVTNTKPEPALALLKYFARPAAHPIWDKAGLEVVPE